MLNRRSFIQSGALLFGGALFGGKAFSMKANPMTFSMPDESYPHERTWMSFVANDYVWSKKQIPAVKRELALIANTIAKYEPVSVLVSPRDLAQAKDYLNLKHSPFEIRLYEFETDDLWLRDTGPTFVKGPSGEKLAIDFNFNGWGNKQEHDRDKLVARYIAKQAGSALESTDIVLEGGCFEVDGHGTAIMAKSCIINDNRNPGWSQKEIEEELKALLGLRKIIWLEGIRGKDITDGHTDFYARFAKPGEVVVSRDNYKASHDYRVTRENIDILQNSVDADGNPLRLHIIDTPDTINEQFGSRDFAAGYIGYYVCNKAVIAQKFGDAKADRKARNILQKLFPDRQIEQLAIDAIASGGGSIHCATQQEFLANPV